jgi:RND superfamily putative drug exporter
VPAQTYALYRAESQFVSPDGKTVQFYTSLSAGAPTSTTALNATPAVRSAVTSVQHSAGATDSGAAGLAPASYDVSTVSQSDLETIVPVVIVLLALLLGLLLRSIIARCTWWPPCCSATSRRWVSPCSYSRSARGTPG